MRGVSSFSQPCACSEKLCIVNPLTQDLGLVVKNVNWVCRIPLTIHLTILSCKELYQTCIAIATIMLPRLHKYLELHHHIYISCHTHKYITNTVL